MFLVFSYFSWYWVMDSIVHARKKWQVFPFTILFIFLLLSGAYCNTQPVTWSWLFPVASVFAMAVWLFRSQTLKTVIREDGWIYTSSAFCFLLFSLFAVFVAFSKNGRWESVASVCLASFVSGIFGFICMKLLTSATEKQSQRWPAAFGLFGVALIFPLVVPTAGSLFFEAPFKGFGLRQQAITISLSPSNWERYRALQPEYSEYLKRCGGSKESWTAIHDVDILWHGIGQRSLVKLPIPPTSTAPSTKQYMRLEFESSGLITSKSPVDMVCFEVPDIAFSTQSNVLSESGQTHLFDALRPSFADTSLLERVEVIGYADRRPTKGGNDALSTARAENVKLKLQQQFNVDPVKVFARGKGVHQPKAMCGEKLSPLETDECLAPNRRVEIRVILQNKKAS